MLSSSARALTAAAVAAAPRRRPGTSRPAARAGKASVSVAGGLATKKLRYFAPRPDRRPSAARVAPVRGRPERDPARGAQRQGARAPHRPGAPGRPLGSVQLPRRQPEAARASSGFVVKHSATPAAGGLPGRPAHPGGALAGGSGRARHEGRAAPASAALARLRHARRPATTTAAPRGPCSPSARRTTWAAPASPTRGVFAKLLRRHGAFRLRFPRRGPATSSSTGRARCWCWLSAGKP